MLDLINLWKNTTPKSSSTEQFKRNYPKDSKASAIKFDTTTTQSSFEFQEPPHVIFVKKLATMERADFYNDLPEIHLTQLEKECCANIVTEQSAKDPHFYDGENLIIKGVIYDESNNALYLEARKVFYSFLVALGGLKFPENSDLYQQAFFKVGVLAPLVTRDEMTIILQRKDGLHSVPAGFLEPKGTEKRLNFNDNKNLVTATASDEITEEIAGIKGTENLRFEFSSPQITSISFRQTASNSLGSIDFIAPSYVNCHSSYLQYVACNNLAKDAHEHAAQNQLIPLDSNKRNALLEKLLTGQTNLPGSPLYLPVALSLARLENRSSFMELPRSVPNSASIAWPLGFFMPKVERLITQPYEELVNKI